MATLTGQSVSSTYPMLLKLESAGITSVYKTIEDGNGDDSALQLSTLGIKSTGLLESTGATTLSSTLSVALPTTLSDTLWVGGATSLQNTLGVAGNTNISGTLSVAAATTLHAALGVTGVATFAAGTALLPAITTTGDADTGSWFPAPNTVAVSTGGTERIRINSTGNVGIGTTDVTYGGQLTVKAASVTSLSLMNSNFSAASSGTQLNSLFGATTGDTYAGLQVNDGGGLSFNDLVLNPNGGNVGIGTTSPTTALYVSGVTTSTGGFVGSVTGNVTGNSATATTLATARNIQVSGDVTGTASFDGSASINIVTTLVAQSVPAGSVFNFAASTAPTGYLECSGAAVSRTTYAALFAVTGTVFGVGDGSTTFNLPNLRGEFVRGFDNGRGIDSGRVFGSAQSGDMLSHSHFAFSPDTVAANSIATNPAAYCSSGMSMSGTYFAQYQIAQSTIAPSVGTISSYGGTETRPRNIALLYCIKT